MLVKVLLTLEIDEEEYHMPVDGFVDDEIHEALHEFIYDIDGIDIKHIKIVSE
jgi:hypothetical protein